MLNALCGNLHLQRKTESFHVNGALFQMQKRFEFMPIVETVESSFVKEVGVIIISKFSCFYTLFPLRCTVLY